MSGKIGVADVARLSGVSRATVDRVLNKRPGVNPKTAEIVMQAVRKLRYSASALDAQYTAEIARIDILLPEGNNPFFAELGRSFSQALEELGRNEPAAHLTTFDPYEEQSLLDVLDAVAPGLDALVLSGVDTPRVRQRIDEIAATGTRVLTFISDLLGSRRSAYIGLDNFAAGRTAGRLMCDLAGVETGTMAVLAGHLHFRHQMDRYSGFRQIIKQMKPKLKVVLMEPTSTDAAGLFEMVRGLGERHPDLAGLYILGAGNPTIYQALEHLPDKPAKVIGHELTTESRRALERGQIDLVIAQMPIEIARITLRTALGWMEKPPFCETRIFLAENLPSRRGA